MRTEQEALDWYLGKPRVLRPEVVKGIHWNKIADFPIDGKLLPIIRYMADVEGFISHYYNELLFTFSRFNPVIKKFAGIWKEEEKLHGELLQKFLEKVRCKFPTDSAILLPGSISAFQKIKDIAFSAAGNIVGTGLIATHMVFGAVNEFTTLCGYRRLAKFSKHPVLEKILDFIAQEESRHAKFYFNMAKINLSASAWSRRTSRFFMDRFWEPVGQSLKSRNSTDNLIRVLFGDESGKNFFHRHVTEPVQKLPGFEDFTKTTDRIRAAA